MQINKFRMWLQLEGDWIRLPKSFGWQRTGF